MSRSCCASVGTFAAVGFVRTGLMATQVPFHAELTMTKKLTKIAGILAIAALVISLSSSPSHAGVGWGSRSSRSLEYTTPTYGDSPGVTAIVSESLRDLFIQLALAIGTAI
jgi:hypothetical protein